MFTNSDLNFFCHTAPFFSVQTKTANSAHALQCISLYKLSPRSPGQESRREGWTDARSAVGFCLGSGLFGSYNSD